MTPAPAPARDLLPVPRVVALALWTAAYARGDAAPDDALDRARGLGHRHVEHLGVDLFDWMTRVRGLPLVALRPVLPVPGRIAGLAGPPPAVAAALAAEQALVVSAASFAEHTLVPAVEVIGSEGAEGIVVRWTEFEAPHRELPPVASASHARPAFLGALRRAADSTVDLDLVPDEPIAEAFLPDDWTLTAAPPGLDEGRVHLLRLAARTLLLTGAELDALDDPLPPAAASAAPVRSLTEDAARVALLRDLRDAAREAVVDVAGAAATV
ncbi:hypothetical protein [Brachybacterium huguangmaarense]